MIYFSNRSLTREEHYWKLFNGDAKSVVTVERSKEKECDLVKVTGFYVVPKMPSTVDTRFGFTFINSGELCQKKWVEEIVDQYFSDINSGIFCYILEISCMDIDCTELAVMEPLQECCQKIVKEFLFDLKNLAMTDSPQKQKDFCNSLFNSSMASESLKQQQNQSSDVIDVDDLVDESDCENLNIMSKTEYKWEHCSSDSQTETSTSLPKLEKLLTSLWLSEKWLIANETDLIASQEVDDESNKEIMLYKPTKGLSKTFWERQYGQSKKSPTRKSERLVKKSKVSYLDEIPSTSFYNSTVPKRPFTYKIPKMTDRNSPKASIRSNNASTFSIFESGIETNSTANNDALEKLEKYIQETANVEISYMDHDGIILSSDEDGPTQSSKSVSKKTIFILSTFCEKILLFGLLKNFTFYNKLNDTFKKLKYIHRKKKIPQKKLSKEKISPQKNAFTNFFPKKKHIFP